MTPVQPARTGDQRIDGPMRALATNVNTLIGAVPGAEALTELPESASLADVIATLNIIIRRLGQV